MKYLGSQSDNLDQVTKSYVDGRVTANPTLAGTESSLTGLQIGSTKYKVPSGSGGVSYLSVVDGKVCITFEEAS